MLRETKRQSVSLCLRLPERRNVLHWADFRRVPRIVGRVEGVEVVVMHRLPDEVARTRGDVEVHQRGRIEALSLPESNDVLVAEL